MFGEVPEVVQHLKAAREAAKAELTDAQHPRDIADLENLVEDITEIIDRCE